MGEVIAGRSSLGSEWNARFRLKATIGLKGGLKQDGLLKLIGNGWARSSRKSKLNKFIKIACLIILL